jgi:hypothetical protein
MEGVLCCFLSPGEKFQREWISIIIWGEQFLCLEFHTCIRSPEYSKQGWNTFVISSRWVTTVESKTYIKGQMARYIWPISCEPCLQSKLLYEYYTSTGSTGLAYDPLPLPKAQLTWTLAYTLALPFKKIVIRSRLDGGIRPFDLCTRQWVTFIDGQDHKKVIFKIFDLNCQKW